jgi:hypothetical protein
VPRQTADRPTQPFVQHCLELLGSLDAVRARRMFGGWGLYGGEVMVALIAHERLYFDTGLETRPAFERAGAGADGAPAADHAGRPGAPHAAGGRRRAAERGLMRRSDDYVARAATRRGVPLR